MARSKVKYRVAEGNPGDPLRIVFDPLSGDDLRIFRQNVSFGLRPGMEIGEAQAIANFLNEKLGDIIEG